MPSDCFHTVLRDSKARKIDTSPDASHFRFAETRKFMPVLLILTIIVILWFIYITFHCLPLLANADTFHLGWVHLIVFNVISTLAVICYFRAMIVHPGTVPEVNEDGLSYEHAPRDARLSKEDKKCPTVSKETKKTGDPRVCKWCNKYKPDRAHHCRVCRICILKMDHHCPWIYNCVGFNNYKFFYLLCLYAVVDCHFIFWTMLGNVTAVFRDGDTPFLHMFATLFGATLGGFLAIVLTAFTGFHTYLSLKGMTTIEYCELINRDTFESYSKGLLGNICAVLGDNPLVWLLPICPASGNGLSFKTRKEMEKEKQQSDSAKVKAKRKHAENTNTENYGSMQNSRMFDTCCSTGGTSSGNELDASEGGYNSLKRADGTSRGSSTATINREVAGS